MSSDKKHDTINETRDRKVNDKTRAAIELASYCDTISSLFVLLFCQHQHVYVSINLCTRLLKTKICVFTEWHHRQVRRE